MISHELRCIFVHIPRCAGTSVEIWLTGQDYWQVDPRMKHCTAATAKDIYAEYWDSYFKFSIVRHPFQRFLSCLHYASHFGLFIDGDKNIDFSKYHDKFGRDIIVEHDHRFFSYGDVASSVHSKGCVYGNILDATLDAIYHFESLKDDMENLCKTLGVKRPCFNIHAEASAEPVNKMSLTMKDREHIISICNADFTRFDYEF